MSAHDTAVTDGLTENTFHVFASTGRVRYKVAGSTPVSLAAVIGNEQKERARTGGTVQIKRTLDVTIHANPASTWGGVAEPKTTDVLELDGRDYPISRVSHRIGNTFRLTIDLPSLQEHSRAARRERGGR